MDDVTRPLYALTQAVLSALDRGNYAALEPLTTPDLTFVDGHAGAPAVALDRAGLRDRLSVPGGTRRESTIVAYDGHPDQETGWAVVRLRRPVPEADGGTRHELCTATLLWRLTDEGWKLTRWHCTPVRTEAAS